MVCLANTPPTPTSRADPYSQWPPRYVLHALPYLRPRCRTEINDCNALFQSASGVSKSTI
jgi:hypothetical protein